MMGYPKRPHVCESKKACSARILISCLLVRMARRAQLAALILIHVNAHGDVDDRREREGREMWSGEVARVKWSMGYGVLMLAAEGAGAQCHRLQMPEEASRDPSTYGIFSTYIVSMARPNISPVHRDCWSSAKSVVRRWLVDCCRVSASSVGMLWHVRTLFLPAG